MNATGATAQAATNNTAALTDLFTNRGNVKAGGALARGGITASMWNNAGSFLDEVAGGGQSLGAGANKSAMNSINSILSNSSVMDEVNMIMRNSKFTVPAGAF